MLETFDHTRWPSWLIPKFRDHNEYEYCVAAQLEHRTFSHVLFHMFSSPLWSWLTPDVAWMDIVFCATNSGREETDGAVLAPAQ